MQESKWKKFASNSTFLGEFVLKELYSSVTFPRLTIIYFKQKNSKFRMKFRTKQWTSWLEIIAT